MEKAERISDILSREWNMFQKVQNTGGRASCQDDQRGFCVMRGAQFAAWDDAMPVSYTHLEDAARFGVTDGEIVDLECEGTRSGLLHDVVIRANNNSRLECHLDTEEANALGLTSKSNVRIVKKA